MFNSRIFDRLEPVFERTDLAIRSVAGARLAPSCAKLVGHPAYWGTYRELHNQVILPVDTVQVTQDMAKGALYAGLPDLAPD